MQQSNVIFFFLFAAFVIYITIRGELPKYLGFLFSSPVASTNTQLAQSTANGGSGATVQNVATIAETATAFLG